MATDVSWILELTVQPGKEEEFPAPVEDMATKANEPGTLDYQWSTRADGRACHSYER